MRITPAVRTQRHCEEACYLSYIILSFGRSCGEDGPVGTEPTKRHLRGKREGLVRPGQGRDIRHRVGGTGQAPFVPF